MPEPAPPKHDTLAAWRDADRRASDARSLDGDESASAARRAAAHVAAADAWEALACIERALSGYEAALSADPTCHDALERALALRRELGDEEGELRLLATRAATAVAGEQAGAQLALGVALRGARRPLPAVESLRKAIAAAASPAAPAAAAGIVTRARVELAAAILDARIDPPAADSAAPPLEEASALLLECARGVLAGGATHAQEAVGFLQRAIGAAPTSPAARDARSLLAGLYEQAGRHAEAALLLEDAARLLEAERRMDEAHATAIRAAVAHRAAGLADRARALLEPLVAHEAPAGPARRALAEILADQEDVAALCALGEAELAGLPAEAAPARIAAHLDLAGRYQQAAAPHLAIRHLKAALAIDPLSQPAHDRLAELLQQRREPLALCALEETAAAAEEQTGLSPALRATRLARLARIYEERLGDAEHALATLRRLLALPSPSVPPDVVDQARASERRLASKARMWEGLAAVLEREITNAATPKARAEAERRLAQVLKDRGGDARRAIQLYEAALAELPGDTSLLRALEDLYERVGDPAGTVRVLETRLARGGATAERRETLRRLASLYEEQLDDPASATLRLFDLLALAPNDREALLRLERLLAHAGDPRLGDVLEAHADAAASPSERVRLLRASARLAGDPRAGEDAATKSLSRCKKLLRLAPSDAEALRSVAQADGRLHPGETATLLLRAAEEEPSLPRKWSHLRTAAALSLEQTPAGLRVLREQVALCPADGAAWQALLVAAERQRDVAEQARALGRLADLEPEPRTKAALIARLSELLALLADHSGALAALERATKLAPRDREPWRRRRALELGPGGAGVVAAIRTLERELAATAVTGGEKTALLMEEAAIRRERAGDVGGAIAALERATEAAPDDPRPRRLLVELYEQAGDVERLCEQAEWLLGRVSDERERHQLATATAGALRRWAGDPRRAFSGLKRAHRSVPDAGLLADLRAAAEAAGLHEELLEILESERRSSMEPATRRALAREAAGLLAHSLGSPRRAAELRIGVLREDPQDTAALADAEQACEAAEAWDLLVEAYGLAERANRPPAERADILLRSARVREDRLHDPSAATDDLVRAVALVPADRALGEQLARLAEQTGRHDVILAAFPGRFDAAADLTERRRVAEEAAAVAEQHLGDRRAALRALLRLVPLAANDTVLEQRLWELARATAAEPPPPPPASPPRAASREPTIELRPVDLLHVRAPEAREPTLELDTGEFRALTRTAAHEAARPHAGTGPESIGAPWEEIAFAYAALPAADARGRAARARRVASMWAGGAHDLPRAFAALGKADQLSPGETETTQLAVRLADEHGAAELLLAHLSEAVDRARATEVEAALAVLLGERLEKAGRSSEAEARYRAALGIAPERGEALARLEALYRKEGRTADLAALLEERIAVRTVAAGERGRSRRELALLYEEELGQPYEAIAAWEALLGDPSSAAERAETHAALARLYLQVGRARKAADALVAQADALDQDQAPTASVSAVELRRRAAELFERDVGLPERAIEIHQALAERPECAPAALASLDRLFEARGRHAELAEVLARRVASATGEERIEILKRRAQLLRDRLGAADQAAVCLREIAAALPGDDGILEQLANTLLAAGRAHEAEDILVSRVAAAEAKGAPTAAIADRLLEVALLRSRRLGNPAGALEALRRAHALAPDHAGVHAELERLRSAQGAAGS